MPTKVNASLIETARTEMEKTHSPNSLEPEIIDEFDTWERNGTLHGSLTIGCEGCLLIDATDERVTAKVCLRIVNAVVGDALEVVWTGETADPSKVANLLREAIREGNECEEGDRWMRTLVLPRSGNWSAHPDVLKALKDVLSGEYPERLAAVLTAAGITPKDDEACIGNLHHWRLHGAVIFENGQWCVHQGS